MPFGIPPSSPRAVAAGDFCDSTNEQLHQLIVDIVTPVALLAEDMEVQIGDVEKCVKKAYKRCAGQYAKGVDNVIEHIGSLLGYIAQGTEQTLLAIQDAQTGSDGEEEEAPPEPPPEPVGEFVVPKPPPPSQVPAGPQPDYHGPALGTKGNPKYEALVIPQAPKPLTTFPCPESPQVLTGLGAPVGSAVWCQSVEQTLLFMDELGKQLVEWIDKLVQPEQWASWIDTWQPPDDWSGWVKSLAGAIKELVKLAVQLAGRGIRTITDIIRCAWYYTQTLTPLKRPVAYLAILTIQNVIDWIKESRVGSQSYLGITLGLNFTLPALTDTLRTLQLYLLPLEVPSVEWVIPAWLRGFITDKTQLECLLRVNGMNPQAWMPYLMARGETLTPEGAIQYARRHGKGKQEQLDWLRSLGYVEPGLAEARLELYDELPNVSDHLHWLQRNVFDTQYVADYGLLVGFEDRFWTAFGKDLEAQGYTKQRAANEYAAHWNRPSPTQMLEWVYRLRPDKYSGLTAFTVKDYERILAEQDYTEYDRSRFAATAYKVPALTYLRDMHRMGILSDAAMKDYHRDLGYTPEDSERFTQVDSFRRQRQRATQGSGWSPAALRKAAAVGQVTADFVRERMSGMGYQPQDTTDLLERAKSDLQYRVISRSISTELSTSVRQVREALRVGVMPESAAVDALTHLGFDAARSQGIASLEIASAKTARVKAAIQRVRHAFAQGEVNTEYATQALASLGVVSAAVSDYLAVWAVEITPGRRRATAGQIVAAVRDGLLDTTEASARLHNLGYTEADTLLFLADAAQQTIATVEALQQLDSLGGKAQAAQLAAHADIHIGLSRKMVARLKEQEPPAKLSKWLKAGIVDAGYVRHRLRLYGWDVEAIAKWIEEVKGREEEEETEPSPNGTAPA